MWAIDNTVYRKCPMAFKVTSVKTGTQTCTPLIRNTRTWVHVMRYNAQQNPQIILNFPFKLNKEFSLSFQSFAVGFCLYCKSNNWTVPVRPKWFMVKFWQELFCGWTSWRPIVQSCASNLTNEKAFDSDFPQVETLKYREATVRITGSLLLWSIHENKKPIVYVFDWSPTWLLTWGPPQTINQQWSYSWALKREFSSIVRLVDLKCTWCHLSKAC